MYYFQTLARQVANFSQFPPKKRKECVVCGQCLAAATTINSKKPHLDAISMQHQKLTKYFIFHLIPLANWSIVNLRPAPPLRPTLISSNSSSGGGGAILANTKKSQPTYEEDALVLRVIEAYCVAYQNPTRNALHSGSFTHLVLSIACGFFFYSNNS